MYVCVCNQVTDSQIREAREEGAYSLACLKDKLNVAACCGRCEDSALEVLHEGASQQNSDLHAASALYPGVEKWK